LASKLKLLRVSKRRKAVAKKPKLKPVGDQLKYMRIVARLEQKDVAKRVGVTPHTISRWELDHRRPSRRRMRALVSLFYPLNPAGTDRLAQTFGSSLAALGIALPPPVVAPVVATVSLRHAADAIVLAAAEASDVPVSRVRAIVAAAFRRAREMGLGLDAIERGLEPPVA
jgi:DNA-binding XRE family transcriptional regulator